MTPDTIRARALGVIIDEDPGHDTEPETEYLLPDLRDMEQRTIRSLIMSVKWQTENSRRVRRAFRRTQKVARRRHNWMEFWRAIAVTALVLAGLLGVARW